MARSVTYSVVPRRNPSEKGAPPKYYAQAQARGDVNIREMSERIQSSCTVNKADVYAVLVALEDVVAEAIQNGEIVRLGDLCTLQVSLNGKGSLTEDDPLVVNMEGEVVCGRGTPSIETGMHLAIYKANPETNAIIHCHPLNCVALTLKRRIKTDLTPEGVLLLGEVPTVGYYTPGSEALANAVASKSKSKAILMERHGAITQGKDLVDAYNKMEELEFQAKLQMLVGRCRGLPRDEVEKLSKM